MSKVEKLADAKPAEIRQLPQRYSKAGLPALSW